MKFDQQTIEDLEFSTIRDWLENYALSETAKQRLSALSPMSNREDLEKELRKVNELLEIKTEGETFPRIEFEELQSEIKLLPIKNASINLEGFMKIHMASVLTNSLLHFFDKREKEYPILATILDEVYYTKEIIDAIELVFDKKRKCKRRCFGSTFRNSNPIKIG